MVELMKSGADKQTLETLQATASNIISAISNVVSVSGFRTNKNYDTDMIFFSQGMSDTVNNKTSSLSSDYKEFLNPDNFDSDPETPENNPCKKYLLEERLLSFWTFYLIISIIRYSSE